MSEGSNGPAWGKCYQAVMRDPALSVNAKALYAYLASFSDEQGRCYPSVSVIREEIGMKSNDRYYDTLHELQDRGILTINKLKRGNRFAKNEYVLYTPDNSENRTAEYSESRTAEYSGNRTAEYSENRTTNRPPINRSHKNKTSNNTHSSKTSKTDVDVAIATIREILNSRRWKQCLQIKGGYTYLNKPSSMTWDDVISAAYEYIAHFPEPTEKTQNDWIQWYSFSDFLEEKNIGSGRA